MRIVFLGTAELACPCLAALANLAAHEVVAVVTQPDRPKGRDLRLAPPPVKVLATARGLPVLQPERIRDTTTLAALGTLRPDLVVVVAYGQLLPRALLELPPRGCINVHASLLPRWRGAAPIQFAILHGDAETGVSTMHLVEQLDAGDVILQRATPITATDTAATLHERLAALGAGLLVETVQLLANNQAPRLPQDERLVTYARKIDKEAGRIDWQQPAVAIERQVRAFNPWPSAFTLVAGQMLKVWRAAVIPGTAGPPGALVAGGVVGTREGGLQLLEVQPAGGKRLSFADFQRGHRLPAGLVLG